MLRVILHYRCRVFDKAVTIAGVLRSAAAALRPSSPRPSTNFFTNHQGALARVLADQNTPPVARAWGYRMNMGMDVFESMFAKAKATEREALLAS